MKMQENEVRNIYVKIRMNKAEVEQLRKLQKQSSEKSLSNYIRNLALKKPVIVKYRNQTADDFLKEMIQMKKELNAIGNNFNQVVHKLNILDTIPEFRFWVKYYQGLHQSVSVKVQDIHSKVIQLYEQWLLK